VHGTHQDLPSGIKESAFLPIELQATVRAVIAIGMHHPVMAYDEGLIPGLQGKPPPGTAVLQAIAPAHD
jgi:hypothetical protein